MTTFLKTMLCARCYFWKRRGGNIRFSKYPAVCKRGLRNMTVEGVCGVCAVDGWLTASPGLSQTDWTLAGWGCTPVVHGAIMAPRINQPSTHTLGKEDCGAYGWRRTPGTDDRRGGYFFYFTAQIRGYSPDGPGGLTTSMFTGNRWGRGGIDLCVSESRPHFETFEKKKL